MVFEKPNNLKWCFELWEVKNNLTIKNHSEAQDVSRLCLLSLLEKVLGNLAKSQYDSLVKSGELFT